MGEKNGIDQKADTTKSRMNFTMLLIFTAPILIEIAALLTMIYAGFFL